MNLGRSRARRPDSCSFCGIRVVSYHQLIDGRCHSCRGTVSNHMAVLAALQAEYDTQPEAIQGRLAAQAKIEETLA